MKLFSGFLLVLAFLAVSACTGSDETTEVVKILCSTTGELLEEGEKCPPPEDTSNNNTSGNQGGSTGGQTGTSDTSEPNRSDCIKVQGVNLKGTDQDDVICGNDRNNEIDGLEGDDTISGGAGDDTLIGGDDRDTLKGEAGNDILRGGQDNDILDGGAGTDTADYSMENLNDANPPVLAIATGASPVEVNLAEGQATDTYMDEDTLISIENVIGTTGNDTIIGDDGPNEIDGGGGTDELLDGGAGSDTIVVTTTLDLNNPTAENANIKNFENIKGKPATADATTGPTITGDDNPNIITGTDLTDILNGAGGNDTLNGNEGDDDLNGGAGIDKLIGGAGADCFLIAIPASFADATVPEDGVSSDPDNADRKAVIRSTKDTISDYEDGDSIVIGGDAEGDPVVYGTDTSKSSIAVKSVIIHKGRIEVVTQAYRAFDNKGNAEATDDVRGISQQTEQLVVVSGLTEARFDTVSTGTACP